jgi:hypothetical protein
MSSRPPPSITPSLPDRENFVNGWTPRLERMAHHVMGQASGYSWMYERMVSSAKSWGKVFSVASGILAGLVGTEGIADLLAMADVDTSCDIIPQWLVITTTVLSFSIIVVVVLNNTCKFDVVKSEGLAAQVSFARLARSIGYQLVLTPSARQEGQDFVKGVLAEIDQLKLTSPTIDRAAKISYTTKFKNNPVYNQGDVPLWVDYRTGAVEPQPFSAGGLPTTRSYQTLAAKPRPRHLRLPDFVRQATRQAARTGVELSLEIPRTRNQDRSGSGSGSESRDSDPDPPDRRPAPHPHQMTTLSEVAVEVPGKDRAMTRSRSAPSSPSTSSTPRRHSDPNASKGRQLSLFLDSTLFDQQVSEPSSSESPPGAPVCVADQLLQAFEEKYGKGPESGP